MDFSGNKTILHDTVMMDIIHYIYVKMYRMYKIKREH